MIENKTIANINRLLAEHSLPANAG